MNIWRISLLLVSFTSLSACNDKHSTVDSEYANIQRADLQTKVIHKSPSFINVSFDGIIEAVNKATVSAQTAGRIALLPYDIGDYVEQGSTIAQITSVEQNASVEAANSSLAEAEALALEAQKNFERSQNVFAKKLIAKAEFDRSTAALKAAQSRVKNAQSSVDTAQQNLSYTHLRAPYSGFVSTRYVQVGEVVAPGTPILSGVSLDNVRVTVEVPQQYIEALRLQQRTQILLPNGESVSATDIHISPSANPSTHTFKVLINLTEANAKIFPGSLVKVSFVIKESEQLHIPRDALVKRGEILAVYTIKNSGLIHLNYIRTGAEQLSDSTGSAEIPVISGLDDGETIALDPIAAAIAYKQQRATMNHTTNAGDSQ